ncbi:MAG: hypothetical protein ACJASK_002276, partial [Ilumatobacter sp.]
VRSSRADFRLGSTVRAASAAASGEHFVFSVSRLCLCSSHIITTDTPLI